MEKVEKDSALIDLMDRSDGHARMNAMWKFVEALRDKKVDITPFIHIFEDRLNDIHDPVVFRTAEALAYHYMNKGEWGKVKSLIEHDDEKISIGATNSLASANANGDVSKEHSDILKLGELTENKREVDFLISQLKSHDPEDRYNAAFKLGQLALKGVDVSDAIPELAKHLDDRDGIVKRNVRDALRNACAKEIDISAAIPKLIQMLGYRQDWIDVDGVKEILQIAVRKECSLPKGRPKEKKTIYALMTALGNEDEKIREGAAKVLRILNRTFFDRDPLTEDIRELVRSKKGVKRIRLKEGLSEFYREFMSKYGYVVKLDKLKTERLPKKTGGRFRARRMRG